MTRPILSALCGSLILCAAAAAQATDADTTLAFDAVHYDIHLDFDLRHKRIAGMVSMTAFALRHLRDVDLDASGATMTIDSVFADGMKMEFAHARSRLKVYFPERVDERTQFEVSVYYHATSAYGGQYDDGGVYFISDDRLATISEPTFARRWWPCNDVPSDKATAHINLTVPDSLTAVSNGLLKDVSRKGGKATFAWETNYPIATYLISAAAAPYVKFSTTYVAHDSTTMPIDFYVYPEDLERAKEDFRNTREILAYFARTFREYPFHREKFGMVEVDGNTTMEHQTLCSIQKSMITGKRTFETTFIHETAHHWWGNFITPANWRHTWLSEGFATYAEALYVEATEGKEASMRLIREWMGDEQGMYAGSVIGRSDTAFWDSFAPRVYMKGAMVLHMLRGITGDSAFFAIMKNFLDNPATAYGNVVTEDFRKACENVHGTSLGWFFDEWVYSSPDSIDRPEYRVAWDSRQEKDGYRVTLHVEQTTADKLLYRMPIHVRIKTTGGTNDFVIQNSLAKESFSFTVTSPPSDLLFDPEERIMKLVIREKR